MRPQVISAIPTAFQENGALDLAGTSRTFTHALDGGVDALLVNGTTAEFPALSKTERLQLVEAALRLAGSDRVIAHIGASSGYEARALAADAVAAGATTLAAITPFYLPASLDMVRRYFDAIRQAAPDTVLYAYLFPARTNVELSPRQIAEIIAEFGLSGVKLSIAGVDFLRELVPLLPPNTSAISGNDRLVIPVHEAGGTGVVSGVSSAVPRPFVALAETASLAAHQRALAQDAVDAAVDLLGPSISVLKAALKVQGIIGSAACRMAIDPAGAGDEARIAILLERLGKSASPQTLSAV